MKFYVTLILIIASVKLYSQDVIYSDLITTLTLRHDGTFLLDYSDPVFHDPGKSFHTGGYFKRVAAGVILNPQLQQREPRISVEYSGGGNLDSVKFRINYRVIEYKTETDSTVLYTPFEMVTIFLNGKPYNLVREPIIRTCAFSPKIRNQIIIAADSMVCVPRKEIRRLAFMAHGLDKPVELPVPGKTFDVINIEYVLPVDEERMPRNRTVRLRGKNAYFYTIKGKPSELLTPLTLVK